MVNDIKDDKKDTEVATELDLMELERRAYIQYHEDGIADLGIALFLLMWGLAFGSAMSGMVAIIPAIGMPLWIAAKKLITIPRLGVVEFSPERKAKEKDNMSMLTVLLTLTAFGGLVVFVGVSGIGGMPLGIVGLFRANALLSLGFTFAIVVAAVGYVTKIPRMYGYAALIVVSFLAEKVVDVHPRLLFLVPGVIILVSGTVVLYRFLRENPLPEVPDAAE